MRSASAPGQGHGGRARPLLTPEGRLEEREEEKAKHEKDAEEEKAKHEKEKEEVGAEGENPILSYPSYPIPPTRHDLSGIHMRHDASGGILTES